MKRFLPLFLVLIIIFTNIPVFGAPQNEIEAGNTLKSFGVLEGNKSGGLMLDNYLKRQDLVVLMSRLYGEKELAGKYPVQDTFTDVNNSFYKPYIYWSVNKGLFQGRSETEFGYDDDITVRELQTVLLRALGYGSEITSSDIVPGLADNFKIMDGLSANADSKATRGLMAAMTLNALKCTVKGESYTLGEQLGFTLP